MHYIKAECNELLLKCIQNQEKKESIDLELLGEDLILLTLNLKSRHIEKTPNYYRILGNGVNPPLEIGIDTMDYSIQSITVFLDYATQRQIKNSRMNREKGTAIVSGEIFRKNGYDFIDNVGDYVWEIRDGELICVFGELYDEIKKITNQEISILFNEKNKLIGFCVKNVGNSILNLI